MMLPLAIALCLASGFLTVVLARPESGPLDNLLFRLSLAAGFGLGIFSVVFYVVRFFNLNYLLAIDTSVVAVLAVLYLFRRPTIVAAAVPTRNTEDLAVPGWLRPFVITAFFLAVAIAFYSAILRSIVHPHGDGWDAFAIWNLHARFLFLGGANWRDGFSALIPWSHPDYPLLLPAAIAHFWTFLGTDSPDVPGIISLIFTISTLSLLYASLNRIRGTNAAMLGTLALASTPFFIEQGSAQYADVPLSFFFLATIALFCLSCQDDKPKGIVVLAGLSAGLAAWTKNEGGLFLLSALCAQLLMRFPPNLRAHPLHAGEANLATPESQHFAAFVFGVLPVLLVIFWFKHGIAPPGDLFSSPSSMLEKLLTPSRAWAVLRWYVRQSFRFGKWWIAPGTLLLVVLYLATGSKEARSRTRGVSASNWTLAMTLAGYFAIYLITPYDIYWHLRFSLSRLFLQVWPAILFLFFTYLSGPLKTSQNDPEIHTIG